MEKRSIKKTTRRTSEELAIDREIESDAGFHLNLAFELARDGENTLAYFFLAPKSPRKKKAFMILDEAERQLKGALQSIRKARKHY